MRSPAVGFQGKRAGRADLGDALCGGRKALDHGAFERDGHCGLKAAADNRQAEPLAGLCGHGHTGATEDALSGFINNFRV